MKVEPQSRSGLAALMVAVLASAAAQLFLKTGVLISDILAAAPGEEWRKGVELLHSRGLWWLIGGLGFYAVSLLAWLKVLTRLPLSVAYPMLGVSYLLVYAGAVASPVLSEALTPLRAVGVLLVAGGAGLIAARSGSE